MSVLQNTNIKKNHGNTIPKAKKITNRHDNLTNEKV
jgi:hypothetical protein